MIDVASRAKDGVKIPTRKGTRQGIMDMFHENLANLKTRLAVHSFD